MESGKKFKEPKNKINFIERNKLLAASKKKPVKSLNRVTEGGAANGTDENKLFKERLSKSRPQTSLLHRVDPAKSDAVSEPNEPSKSKGKVLRPASAPVTVTNTSNGTFRPKRGLNKFLKKNETEKDIISNMIDRNLHEPLLKIFLSFSSTTLTACRYVCTSWYSYMKIVFWRELRVRRELEERLAGHWKEKRFHKVELKISGHTCKNKCSENFRDCLCKEKLDCVMSGNCLVVDFGGSDFYGEYIVNNNTVVIERKHFDIEQFQLNLQLKLDLAVETNSWLNTPVFLKKKVKQHQSKLEVGTHTVEVHPADDTYLLIRDRSTHEIKNKFQPYTSQSRKSVDSMSYACGRLAVLINGRVSVYCAESLARGSNKGALLLEANKTGSADVHYFFLNENILLTVAGCTVTMYDFWRFTLTSLKKDFQC